LAYTFPYDYLIAIYRIAVTGAGLLQSYQPSGKEKIVKSFGWKDRILDRVEGQI
jgi:hypothetical protein